MSADHAVAIAAKVHPLHSPKNIEQWEPIPDDIIIGKDVLELLNTSMYIDPMTIYREYVQNAADAIDDAKQTGLLPADSAGTVDIAVKPATRIIRIRDNGTGIPWNTFAHQLTALGASSKRGTPSRGFRGVGRLAGLGYCQELIFRSRSTGETMVSEQRWDCRRLQSALRSVEFTGGLSEIIREIVSVRRVSGDGLPDRFFEVELRGVIRHRNDRLLSPISIAEYLAQVAPLPFAPEFRFGTDIKAALAQHLGLGDLQLTVEGVEGQIYRPHRDKFEIGDDVFDTFSDLEVIEIPGVDGNVAAIAWILHHGYTGAIPTKASVKGLRLRTGNIQVGDAVLLEDLFPEQRFNAWSVGEVHIVDRRIIPNGRRDHFQPNVHFNNILNHMSPTTREIARRCRTSSIRRRWIRDFELQRATVQEKIDILKQGSIGPKDRIKIGTVARRSLATMAKIVRMDGVGLDTDGHGDSVIRSLTARLDKALGANASASPLAHLTPARRKMYEHCFGLIYECSVNHVAAKSLIDRMLVKID